MRVFLVLFCFLFSYIGRIYALLKKNIYSFLCETFTIMKVLTLHQLDRTKFSCLYHVINWYSWRFTFLAGKWISYHVWYFLFLLRDWIEHKCNFYKKTNTCIFPIIQNNRCIARLLIQMSTVMCFLRNFWWKYIFKTCFTWKKYS